MLKHTFLSSVFLTIVLGLSGCSDTSKGNGNASQSGAADAAQPEKTFEPYPSTPLPENLSWQTNNTDEIFADPAAQRGGRFTTWMLSFPLTLRFVGPDANGSFAHYIRGNIMSLVDMHPNTRKPIPSLATHWAFADDGKTVFYKLDPDARWSDGKPVTADDFMFAIEFMRSQYIVEPWYNHHYTNYIVDLKKHDDYTISITGATIKPQDELLFEYGMAPIARHFHQLDENWVQNYNWKIEPNTGPYQISAVKKGKYIEYERKANWWANNKRYYQHRFNPDKIRIKVIRDQEVAFQHFMKGDIDSFPVVRPAFWHDKSKGEAFDKGYIHKVMFYNDRPQPAAGMWLNADDPILSDKNVRIGVSHATNIDKVIRTVLRGEYQRLDTHNVGYGEYSNTAIKARQFDLKKAATHFDKAGWQEKGSDGIRTKNGQRLSLTITYANPDDNKRLVVLKEEAKKAGLEFNLQQLDASASFKKILEKKHQIAWMAWSGGGYSPRYWEFYHSVNAHKTQTNNITNTDNPEMDKRIDAYREQGDKAERIRLAKELEQLAFDEAVMIPTFMVPYTRSAYWRWLKLPEFTGTRASQDLFDVTDGLFWIDEAAQAETLAAKKSGKSFSPVTKTDDSYRQQ